MANRIANIKTNVGTIRFELLDDESPKTAENFRLLAEAGKYDGVIFHRVTKGFIIQGGDPTGTRRGGARALALQTLEGLCLAVVLGEGGGGATVGVLCVHVGPVLDEELHGVGEAGVGGGDECGEAFGRVRVHVGPVGEERVERGDATVGGGEDDGREPRVVARVHVRALRYQRVDAAVLSAARGGEQECRAAAVAARVHVRAAGDEHLHDGEVFLELPFGGLSLPLTGEGDLLRGGLHQGRVVVFVARVDRKSVV